MVVAEQRSDHLYELIIPNTISIMTYENHCRCEVPHNWCGFGKGTKYTHLEKSEGSDEQDEQVKRTNEMICLLSHLIGVDGVSSTLFVLTSQASVDRFKDGISELSWADHRVSIVVGMQSLTYASTGVPFESIVIEDPGDLHDTNLLEMTKVVYLWFTKMERFILEMMLPAAIKECYR